VHGLLTATLPTKIGGDLHVLARKMVFNFLRPVWGNTIRCEVTVTHCERLDSKAEIAFALECFNQDGKKVLDGSFEGIIRL
jgi:acyl dehydratase